MSEPSPSYDHQPPRNPNDRWLCPRCLQGGDPRFHECAPSPVVRNQPKCCGRYMLAVYSSGSPIWWCADCHAKWNRSIYPVVRKLTDEEYMESYEVWREHVELHS